VPIIDRFREIYPSSPRPRVFRAPGRINLIGEHTDYNLGLVLPMAIELECQVASAPSNDGWLRIYSENLSQGAQWPVDQVLNLFPRGDWSDRVAGIAWALARNRIPVGAQNVLIASSVPLGGGLSSSAALGVSLALALGTAKGDRLLCPQSKPADPSETIRRGQSGLSPFADGAPLDLARLAHAAETDFVGIPCGIMDQFISAYAQSAAALLLDCRTLESRPIPMPSGLAIVAVNSMVKHELGDSAYRTRVAECAQAARALKIATLRDAKLDDLAKLAATPLKRARHVITENARVEAFAEAAQNGDLETMGRLAVESHASLRDDYEVSCPELDFLVEAALAIPGVFGARLTGGGFGGSTVNFLRPDAIQNFTQEISARYQTRFGRTPEIHLCIASAGASEIFL